MRTTLHAIVFLTLSMALSASLAQADGVDDGIWQGAFRVQSVSGAMELRLSLDGQHWGARLRFTPHGQEVEPQLRELKASPMRLSFVTDLAGTEYRFSGARQGDRWEGAMIPTVAGKQSGKWSLIRLASPMEVPAATLPKPTGQYAVGRKVFAWRDEKRRELETRKPDDRRELLVYLFYPAQPETRLQRAPYMPDADTMRGELTEEQVQGLQKVETHSLPDASVAEHQHPFPVIVFVPGGYQKVLAYSSLIEELTSHGYVVAAIEPPYNPPAMRFPDGRVIRFLPREERGWPKPTTLEEELSLHDQRATHSARDMIFVLDQLALLNKESSPFANCFDLSRCGGFGHSRGGHAAGKVRLVDPRFRAGLNLDGSIEGKPFPPDANGKGGRQPFLWIEKQFREPTAERLAQMPYTKEQFAEMRASGDRLLETIQGETARVIIARPGIDHLDFSDGPLLRAEMDPAERHGKLRTMEIVRAYACAFFDAHLKGQRQKLSELLDETRQAFPEVTVHASGMK